MQSWVLLLRGVNVGGHGKLPMADLRALLTGLGCADVATYIQSGNAVFTGAFDAAKLADQIASAIQTAHGFRPAALILPGEDLHAIHRGFPFPEARDDPKTGHVWFPSAPATPDLGAMAALAAPDERFQMVNNTLCLHAPSGIGRSKLAPKVEALLGVPATARNLNSLSKLSAMITDLNAPAPE